LLTSKSIFFLGSEATSQDREKVLEVASVIPTIKLDGLDLATLRLLAKYLHQEIDSQAFQIECLIARYKQTARRRSEVLLSQEKAELSLAPVISDCESEEF
jgi:hypothetical protein